jgi:hypothetical protein
VRSKHMRISKSVVMDVDVDVDAPVELRPTCREFYQAASFIARYMDGMDTDPIAGRIEALLGSFNRQICLNEVENMWNSSLTDFFTVIVTSTISLQICVLSCNDNFFCEFFVSIFSTILKLHTPSNPIAQGVHQRVWVMRESTVHLISYRMSSVSDRVFETHIPLY